MKLRALVPLTILVLLTLGSASAFAAPPAALDLKVDGVGTVSAPLQIVLFLTLLSFCLLYTSDAADE